MTSNSGPDRDTQVDVRLVLSALWIAVLFVFAYVDQAFLILALVHVLVPILMVVLSLVLPARKWSAS